MAVKTREEIISAMNTKLGEDTSDEAISLIEDITDTLADFETKTADQTNWKAKYEESDKAWRKKYRDRFNGENNDNGGGDNGDNGEDKPLTYEALFKEE